MSKLARKTAKFLVAGNSFSINSVDFSKVNIPCIAVNRFLRYSEEHGYVPDYLLIVDDDVIQQEYERIKKFHPKLILYGPLWHNYHEDLEQYCDEVEWVTIRHVGSPNPKLSGHLFLSSNTATYAIEMAYRKLGGVGEIGIIGIDFFHLDKENTHFYGNGAKFGAKAVWERPLRWFSDNKDFFEQENFKLYNLSPYHKQSPLSWMNYKDFEEFVS